MDNTGYIFNSTIYLLDQYRNILSLIALELIFTLPSVRRRSNFGARLAAGIAACLAVASLYLFVLDFMQSLTDLAIDYSFVHVISVLWYTAMVVLAGILIYFCFDVNPTELVWIMLTAYAAQHMIYVIAYECLVMGFFGHHLHILLRLLIYFAVAVVIDAVMYVVFSPIIKKREHLYVHPSWKNCLMLSAVLVVFLASTFINQYNAVGDMQALNLFSVASDVINCVFVLIVQYMSLRTSRINVEKETVEKLLEQEKKQYEAFKNAVDYINIKCHDLKREIRLMVQEGEFDESYFEDITAHIAVYESFIKTGNETLDLLLTDQNLVCIQNGISLSCMVDASTLGMMSNRDIFSLFGNMLDNAVEYVKQVPDQEKRFIRLFVKPKGSMTVIHQENYFEGELNMTGGLPETTKRDNAYHGFGMQSMRRIVEHYGGNIRVSVSDGMFKIDAIIPNQ